MNTVVWIPIYIVGNSRQEWGEGRETLMHSRWYFDRRNFQFTRGTERMGLSGVFPEWTSTERVVFVAPDPTEDTAHLCGVVLAPTALFYGREEV